MEKKLNILQERIHKEISALDFFSEPKGLYEPIYYILSPIFRLEWNNLHRRKINASK